MTQILTCRMRQISLVIVARLRAHLFHKQFTDFLLLDMDGRHHDVTGFLMHQLKDSFSQITFHHINSFLNQEFIQSTFFGQHRFTLDKEMHLVSVQNMQTNLLPNVNTPYLMVVTVYPGASPERVENEVSDVMESALGTISGVKNVTASSA